MGFCSNYCKSRADTVEIAGRRPQSATPVFIIPDEIVPRVVSLKGLHDLIGAARKKRKKTRGPRGASCLVYSLKWA